MITRKRWTVEEDYVLVQAVKANPHNLKECFRTVSKQLGRTEKAAMLHWYKVLSNPNNKKYVGTMFVTLGRKAVYVDRKNHYVTATGNTIIAPKPINPSLWSKIKKFLGL